MIVLAQDEARQLNHNYIGLEHLLLGLFRVDDDRARELLAAAGASADDVRAKVLSSVGRGAEPVSGPIPFTPRAKKALELALREALALGDNYIGPAHVLLGLTAAAGVSASSAEADVDRVKEGVARILSGRSDRLPGQAGIGRILSGSSGRIEVRASSSQWWKRAEIDLRVFGAIIGAAFAIGVLVGWLIWGN